MGAVVDLLVSATDPVTALLVIGLYQRLRQTRRSLHDDVAQVRDRVERVEGTFITDGGETGDKNG